MTVLNKILDIIAGDKSDHQTSFYINNGSRIFGSLVRFDDYFLHIENKDPSAGKKVGTSVPLLVVSNSLATISVTNPTIMSEICTYLSEISVNERYKQDDVIFQNVLSHVVTKENMVSKDIQAKVYLLKSTCLVGMPIAYTGDVLVLFSEYFKKDEGLVKEIQIVMMNATSSILSE